MPIYRVPEISSSSSSYSSSALNANERNVRHQYHPPQRQQQQLQLQQQRQNQHHHQQHHHHQIEDLSPRVVERNNSSAALTPAIPDPDESIVERDIRLQLEREAEIAFLHEDLRTPRSTRSSTSGSGRQPTTTKTERRIETVDATPEPERNHNHVEVEDNNRTINQYSRVGESLIVRELLEQKKREEELRSHYRNIGRIKENVENGNGSSNARNGRVPGKGGGGPVEHGSFGHGVSEDDDVDDEVDFRRTYIKPQSETVIEREVRLLRQREGSLRRVRGYPLPSREERQNQVEVRSARWSAEELRTSSRSAVEDDDISMRRMATNRLKQEMLRERQRELDLRSQGKIYTISEERVGLEPDFSAAATEDSVDSHPGWSASTQQSHHHQQHHQNKPTRDADTLVGTATSATADNRRKTGEVMHSWRTASELRIEEEVREARRREKELREQRRLVNAASISPQQPSPTEYKNKPSYHIM